jgi:hypothetical protein
MMFMQPSSNRQFARFPDLRLQHGSRDSMPLTFPKSSFRIPGRKKMTSARMGQKSSVSRLKGGVFEADLIAFLIVENNIGFFARMSSRN